MRENLDTFFFPQYANFEPEHPPLVHVFLLLFPCSLAQVMCAVNEQLRNFDKTGIKGDGRTIAELSFEQGLKVD